MLFLSIDTSTSAMSISLFNYDKIFYSEFLNIEEKHSTVLLSRIDLALKLIKFSRNDISAIIYNNGPGSFSGIRMGLATAKGICSGLKIPLITFNSLELLAINVFGVKNKIISLLDARMNEAYIGIFDNKLNLINEIQCLPYNEIKQFDINEYTFVGDIFFLDNCNKSLPHQNIITAFSMFSLFKYKQLEIDYDENFINILEPFYIRNIK